VAITGAIHGRLQQLRARRTENSARTWSITPALTKQAAIGGTGSTAVGKLPSFPGSPNVEGDLIQAMLANPHLQVEVENGIYDLGNAVLCHRIHDEHLRPAGKTAEEHPPTVLRRPAI